MPTFQVDLFVLPETIQLESCKLQPFTPYREPKAPPEANFCHIRTRKLILTPTICSFRSHSTRNCLPFIHTLESIKTKQYGAPLTPQSDDYEHLKLQHDTIIKSSNVQVLKNRLSASIVAKTEVKPILLPESKIEALPNSSIDSDYERAESQNIYREIAQNAALALERCDMKKFTDMTVRSQINTRVCQISNSRSQIRRIHNELLSLIQKTPAGNSSPILLTIARKLLVFFCFY